MAHLGAAGPAGAGRGAGPAARALQDRRAVAPVRPETAVADVHGGAIAPGHPLGESGTRLTTTPVHAVRERNARYVLQTMCEAGGPADAMVLERV